MNIEKPCGVRSRFGAHCYLSQQFHPVDLVQVLDDGLRFVSAYGQRPIQSLSLAEYCSLELGECSDHLHHHGKAEVVY